MRAADQLAAVGIVYIAYGAKAIASVRTAYATLRQHCAVPVTVIGAANPSIKDAQFVAFDSESTGRWAKLNLDTLSPYANALYLDADTRIQSGAIVKIFDILNAGFDLVIAPSSNQEQAFLAHSSPLDREMTLQALQNPYPLQLQAGVFGVRWSEATRATWGSWRDEWQRERGQDQGALLRALDHNPLRVWLLGPQWNSRHGDIVEHRFGEAR